MHLDNLTKRYGSFTAVDGLSLDVTPGETYALLGPNGAGKTTTVEILEGLRTADDGVIEVLGLNPITDRTALQRRVGVMLQEGGVYQGATAREVLALFAAYYPDARTPDDLLDLVGLTGQADTMHRRLSGGEKQRLSLAMALVHRPELVFLDEPTAGMDPVARRATWEIIERLQERGATILLTTHFMDEAERLADRVGIINDGRMVAEGSPTELIHARGDVSFVSAPGLPVTDLEGQIGIEVREVREGFYVVTTDTPTPFLVAQVTAWLAGHDALLTELRVGAGGLEDVFLALTEENHR
ncbi:MAG: ABC transporter ATP-binding protein [Acidimicrobiia bacterium]|nr:ABC transporter ATP-binding protein [Acidimicrobiia bacterium]